MPASIARIRKSSGYAVKSTPSLVIAVAILGSHETSPRAHHVAILGSRMMLLSCVEVLATPRHY